MVRRCFQPPDWHLLGNGYREALSWPERRLSDNAEKVKIRCAREVPNWACRRDAQYKDAVVAPIARKRALVQTVKYAVRRSPCSGEP